MLPETTPSACRTQPGADSASSSSSSLDAQVIASSRIASASEVAQMLAESHNASAAYRRANQVGLVARCRAFLGAIFRVGRNS